MKRSRSITTEEERVPDRPDLDLPDLRYRTSSATKPRAIPQLNPGPSSGQTSVVRPGLD